MFAMLFFLTVVLLATILALASVRHRRRLAVALALVAGLVVTSQANACPVATATFVQSAVPVVPFAALAVETQPTVAVQTFTAFATPFQVLNVAATPVNVLNVNVRARNRVLVAPPAQTNVNIRVRTR